MVLLVWRRLTDLEVPLLVIVYTWTYYSEGLIKKLLFGMSEKWFILDFYLCGFYDVQKQFWPNPHWSVKTIIKVHLKGNLSVQMMMLPDLAVNIMGYLACSRVSSLKKPVVKNSYNFLKEKCWYILRSMLTMHKIKKKSHTPG